MREINSGMTAVNAVEARRKGFEDFVKEKNKDGYRGSGRDLVVLRNSGFSDSFGKASYERGMRFGSWVLPDNGDNSSIVLFPTKKEAMEYGKSVLPALKKNGYPRSEICAEKVVTHSTRTNRFTAALAPTDVYSAKEFYVLRFVIRK